jgi:serine/threonine protein kinase
MLAEPAQTLGYQDIAVPGCTVGDLLGSGAYSNVFEATVEEESVDVDRDGYCLFHSVAHQLSLLGERTDNGDDYTHELLRALALSRVNADPRFRIMMSDVEHMDLSRLTGYVDHAAIAALAATLRVNIIIYGAPGGEEVHINADGNLESATADRATLRIVYNGFNHYNSVDPVAAVAAETTETTETISVTQDPVTTADSMAVRVKANRRKTSSSSTKQQLAKKAKMTKNTIAGLKVAIKIFEERNRHMRDHEVDVLNRLRMNSNVPSIVRPFLDICEQPALIVSPVGKKVSPLEGGLKTNKTDFVQLLQVLVHAHSLKICHRDVKPHNMFKDPHGRIILNDWSSAADMNQPVPWVGTEPFYQRVNGDRCPQPVDDLVALVRSVFIMYTNSFPDGDIEHIMSLSNLWCEALRLARLSDINGLRTFFNNI